jgi:hypothetical protein
LFFSVLCTLRYQFLWIVHFWLSLRYSLTFILFPFKTVYKWYYIFSNYLHLLLRPYTKHRQILKYLKNSDSVKSTYCKLYSTFITTGLIEYSHHVIFIFVYVYVWFLAHYYWCINLDLSHYPLEILYFINDI